MGYGICCIGGLRNNLPRAGALLEIPEGVYPLFGLCVGVPKETPVTRPRLPLEAVYFEDRYPADEPMQAILEAYNTELGQFEQHGGEKRPSWTSRMTELFSRPRRTDVADYYRSQGGNLS